MSHFSLKWGEAKRNQSVFTDHESLVCINNKQSYKDKLLMAFVCKFVSICLHNIVFKAKHIPGVYNKLADALSRLQVHTFTQLANLDLLPTEVPHYLQPQSLVP